MRFDGKTVVVTGAASGIGRATSEAFAKAGASVILADLSADKGEEAANQLRAAGLKATFIALDVTSDDSIASFAKAALGQGEVHILANVAGYGKGQPFIDNTPDFWERVVDVNLMGPIKLTRALLGPMIERRSGKIVNVASDAGRVGSSGETVYSGAKGGLIAFSKGLAREMARYSINVNSVCPGPTETPMLMALPENHLEAFRKAIPLKRFAQPSEIASAILFFASDHANYITGQTLSVSGGLAMVWIESGLQYQDMQQEGRVETFKAAGYAATHFKWDVSGKVATITLNRPERKNPLTFESYAELGALFRKLEHASDVKTVVVTGAGGNFCSGGDVHEIIGPLVAMQEADDMSGLLRFTRMTGELVKAMRHCPQPIIAAIDGICCGAGAIIAMASDMRIGTPRAKTGFLFVRVGLAGADMGACAILPRIIGQGRASELLYTGRIMTAEEGDKWGFFNRLVAPEQVLAEAQALAAELADGPTFGNAMTKTCLHQEWAMDVDSAIEAEAQAQAICMQTKDYGRAYRAFVAKQKPVFEGN